MYAVIRTGNQQYRVNTGDTIKVSKLDVEVGAEITLTDVLLLGGGDSVVGAPVVTGASVTAEVTAQDRHPKIIIFKMRRRKGYRRKRGHRQDYTALKITGIHYDPTAAN